MIGGHLLVAYHGCDITTRDALVSGQIPHLTSSQNEYDWLGPGAYFYEGDYERALHFAQAAEKDPFAGLTNVPIATPAVVGALIRVRHCLDMTTQNGLLEFIEAQQSMLAHLGKANEKIPVNIPPANELEDALRRHLDSAVFVWIHGMHKLRDSPGYQLVRGAFPQGRPVSKHSGFRELSHIQLALTDPKCAIGWFLPPGQQLMTSSESITAWANFEKRKRNIKPKPRKNVPTAGQKQT